MSWTFEALFLFNAPISPVRIIEDNLTSKNSLQYREKYNKTNHIEVIMKAQLLTTR